MYIYNVYMYIYIYINICKADPYASNNGDIELMGHPGHFPTFRFRCRPGQGNSRPPSKTRRPRGQSAVVPWLF